LGLAVVRDMREAAGPLTAEEAEDFETDVLAGFVLARSAAGLADSTVRSDIGALGHVRSWFGRPLWEMEPADADEYFGVVLRGAANNTRRGRAQVIRTYFEFLELRHRAEIHRLTGRLAQCPIDAMNRPRGRGAALLRIPPSAQQVTRLFAGWREDLASCRKFAPSARNYAAAKLMAEVGPRVNEVRHLDLDDVKWELGRFGKVHVRQGKGAFGSGPRARMVPLINGADRTLRWFVEDVWGLFDDDHTRPGAPLYPSERRNRDGSCARLGDDALREALADAAARHLPEWQDRVTPHVLRHFCASQLYAGGMDLVAIQEMLGHAWVSTTMGYVHVQRTHIEDAWIAGQQRAAARLEGLA